MRSRLWLRGDWLSQHDGQSFLWLHLDDGRVLAFRLPAAAFEDDAAIGELVEQGTMAFGRWSRPRSAGTHAIGARPTRAL